MDVRLRTALPDFWRGSPLLTRALGTGTLSQQPGQHLPGLVAFLCLLLIMGAGLHKAGRSASQRLPRTWVHALWLILLTLQTARVSCVVTFPRGALTYAKAITRARQAAHLLFPFEPRAAVGGS